MCVVSHLVKTSFAKTPLFLFSAFVLGAWQMSAHADPARTRISPQVDSQQVLERTAQEGTLTLEECFQAALKQSEVLAAQTERIDQAEEKIKQAYGAILPNINFLGSYQKQEDIKSSLGTSISPPFQPSLRFNLSQPLFRGFREFAALKQTKLGHEISETDRISAELALFQDVANPFFATLALEKSFDTVTEQNQVYEKRITELSSWVKIGKSRKSELFSVQASQAKTAAQLKQIQGQIAAARETLKFLTGFTSVARLSSNKQAGEAKPTLDSYLAKIEERPDILAGKSRVEFADQSVSIAKGEYAPSADIGANYWVRRAGVLSQVKWDAALTFTIPIFQGLSTNSRVREAVSQRRQAEIDLQRVRRQADRDVRSLYASLSAEYDRLSDLSRALELAQKTYDEQNREYRYGLVNNIDVLTSLDSLYQSKLELDRSRVEIERLTSQLKAATRSVEMILKNGGSST